MKKTLSILLAMTLLLSGVSAMAEVTFEGTKGTVVMDEDFDSFDAGALTAVDTRGKWTVVSNVDGTAATETNAAKVTITDDKALNVDKVKNLGAIYTLDTALSFGSGNMAADEYVIEFDALLGKRASIVLLPSSGGASYLRLQRLYEGDLLFQIGSDADTTTPLAAQNDGGKEHHYKIVLRSSTYVNDAGNNRLRIYADVYVDGVCRVLNEIANQDMSVNSSRAINRFFVGNEGNAGTATTIDNIEMYYLNGEQRSDVCTKYLDASGNVLFESATSPAETMAAEGSKLTAEIRYQGTVSEDETVRVFVAQFDKDGVLKNVSFADGTVTNNNKITVPVESTEANPLCIDAKADDYLTAFIWTADEMIPLCAEVSVGK